MSDDLERVSLGEIFWDSEDGSAYIEWDGDVMPLNSGDWQDLAKMAAAAQDVTEDAMQMLIIARMMLEQGTNGTIH